MNEIDFVILWVDGNDPAWREEFVRTRQAENDDASEIRTATGAICTTGSGVRNVSLPGCGRCISLPGDTCLRGYARPPQAAHRESPGFHPAEYLPTFNSNTIELNIHRIEGLADRFVLFNDDTFLTRGCGRRIFFAGVCPATWHA